MFIYQRGGYRPFLAGFLPDFFGLLWYIKISRERGILYYITRADLRGRGGLSKAVNRGSALARQVLLFIFNDFGVFNVNQCPICWLVNERASLGLVDSFQ